MGPRPTWKRPMRPPPRSLLPAGVARRSRLRRPAHPAHRGAAPGRGLRRARVSLKREDLLHTGAHKINNVLGQVLLARRMGKRRIIAETGAGQHGVATATACARYGLECVVYMGEEDVRRQELNYFRMQLLGAKVVPVASGTRTLKDATNEAIRDWVAHVEDTFYVIGSVVGPHPYPRMVRDFQSILGREAREQISPPPDRCRISASPAWEAGATPWASSTPSARTRCAWSGWRRRGRGSHRPPRRDPRRRAARGAPRRPLHAPPGRRRPGGARALHLRGPRLSGGRPRARLASGHRPRRVRLGHRRRGARRLREDLPAGGDPPRAGDRPRAGPARRLGPELGPAGR